MLEIKRGSENKSLKEEAFARAWGEAPFVRGQEKQGRER